MSVWYFASLAATAAWSLCCRPELFAVVCAVTGVYLAAALLYQRRSPNRLGDKLRASAFDSPDDPTLYLSFDIAMEQLDQFLAEYNAAEPADRLTYTHVGLAVFSRAIAEAGLGLKLAFEAERRDPSVHAGVLVDINGTNLGILAANGCEAKGLQAIAAHLNKKIKLMKANKIKQANMQNRIISYFPSFVAKVIMKLGVFVLSDVEIDLYPLTPKNTPRVHMILSNMSNQKSDIRRIYTAFSALMRFPMIVVLSDPKSRAVAKGGKLATSRTMTVDMVVDARYASYSQLGHFQQLVLSYWEGAEGFTRLLTPAHK